MSERNPASTLPLWQQRDRPEPTGRKTAATRAIAHDALSSTHKRTQDDIVYAHIRANRHDGKTRPEIARELGMVLGTAYPINIVCRCAASLIRKHLVVEPRTMGRESSKRVREGAHVLCAIEYVPKHQLPPVEAA